MTSSVSDTPCTVEETASREGKKFAEVSNPFFKPGTWVVRRLRMRSRKKQRRRKTTRKPEKRKVVHSSLLPHFVSSLSTEEKEASENAQPPVIGDGDLAFEEENESSIEEAESTGWCFIRII